MTRLRTRRQFIRPWYIPIPGDPGGDDDMAFLYDGATFTPGTLTPDSGTRDITIEVTSGGNAITSGIACITAFTTSDLTFDGSTAYDSCAQDIGSASNLARVENYTPDPTAYSVIIPAAAGHIQFTIAASNGDAGAKNCYVSILLPSGGIASSAAISIPGVGGG